MATHPQRSFVASGMPHLATAIKRSATDAKATSIVADLAAGADSIDDWARTPLLPGSGAQACIDAAPPTSASAAAGAPPAGRCPSVRRW
ncbi:hypothetical protein [Streptomyces mirabilis]|uniref:hypothetical protein n=1 Tax=Streptomyces mirabilis TaxID=68239 RepID=UPI0033BCABA1